MREEDNSDEYGYSGVVTNAWILDLIGRFSKRLNVGCDRKRKAQGDCKVDRKNHIVIDCVWEGYWWSRWREELLNNPEFDFTPAESETPTSPPRPPPRRNAK